MEIAGFFRMTSRRGNLGSRDRRIAGESKYDEAVLGSAKFITEKSTELSEHWGLARIDGSMVAWCGTLRNKSKLRTQYQLAPETGRLLIDLLDVYGEDILSELGGPICLLYFDIETQNLIAVRDKLGRIPFFVYRGSGFFAAATDPELIRDHVQFGESPNRQRLAAYLTQAPIAGRSDFVDPLERLYPGEFARAEPSGEVGFKRYYSRRDQQQYSWKPLSVESNILRKRLEVLVREYCTEPVAYMMSGGLDSTALVALDAHTRWEFNCTAPIKTLSHLAPQRRFEDEHSRIDSMRERFALESIDFDLSDGITLTADEFLDCSPGLGPQWHPGSIYEVESIRAIVDHFGAHRIVFGVGGDHLFSGNWVRTVRQIFASEGFGQFWREFCGRFGAVHGTYRLIRRLVGRQLPDSLKQKLNHLTGRTRRRPWLMPELWTNGPEASPDWISMSQSRDCGLLEEYSWPWEYFVREARRKEKLTKSSYVFPYLDPDFVKKYSKLPPAYRCRGNQDKVILRAAVDGLLPEDVRTSPKSRWPAPLIEASLSELEKDVRQLFETSRLADLGLLEVSLFLNAFEKFLAHTDPRTSIGTAYIWSAISAELWLKRTF